MVRKKRPRTYRFSELWDGEVFPQVENATNEMRPHVKLRHRGRPRKYDKVAAGVFAAAVLDALRAGVTTKRIAEILDVPEEIIVDLELDR